MDECGEIARVSEGGISCQWMNGNCADPQCGAGGGMIDLGESENRVIHPVLYEDDDWLVVDKPSGLATHGTRLGDTGLVSGLICIRSVIFMSVPVWTKGPAVFCFLPDTLKPVAELR